MGVLGLRESIGVLVFASKALGLPGLGSKRFWALGFEASGFGV